MRDAPILFDVIDSVAHCVLANPPGNEMNARFFNELTRLRREVFHSLSVAGMIVYGKGRHFSSGADIDELMSMYQSASDNTPVQFLEENTKNFLAITSLPFPVVAVINGCCLGAGLELALACHFRVASSRAVFSLPESTFGLMPGCGGTVRLPGLVGKGKAVEMILRGEMVSAEQAFRCGLVDVCLDKSDSVDAAITLIKRFSNPSRSFLKGERHA